MPTMTNPETGETKEISMEEFMKMMRSGNGSIQQVVTHADGSTSTSTIYGNVPDDGLDHSVNIFVDSEAFNAFIKRKVLKMAKKLPDPESEKDLSELYEMSVDFTDSAIMGILKKTKDALTVKLYTRDEQRAQLDYLCQGSKTWEVNEDGSVVFNTGDLQGDDKTVCLYMLSFMEMRQFLHTSGNLAKLKELGNRGTGVIISATGQADDAEATIVRGLNRPDLPCNMFLLGEQMMRPYMDEMMSDAMASTMTLEEKIEAAENGDPNMMELLAQQYLNGDDVPQDFVQSAYWWQKLADTGNAIGQFNIGLHYAKGCGVPRDFGKAAEWMQKAADNGDEDAVVLTEKYKKAAAAETRLDNDPQAQADLAGILISLADSLEQAGAGRDYEEAFALAQNSAEAGNGEGLWILALAYEHGRGVRRSVSKAIESYRKGAELGHAACQHSLGCYYMRGDKIQKDPKQAFTLILNAAKQGYGLAMKDTGRCYQFGNGVEENMDLAIEWYEKALEVLDDPELDQKVTVFKSLQSMDPAQQEGAESVPAAYTEALEHFIEDERAKESTNIAEAIRYLDANYDLDTETATWQEEVVGTQFEGRNQRIERIRTGDLLHLVRECNNRENGLNISVRNSIGESLGNLSTGTCRILAPIMDENPDLMISAIATEVIPLSKRGPRAKKSILKISVRLQLDHAVQSTLCCLGGDQVRAWAQQLTVSYTTMPTKHAVLLFELYNRLAGEYDNWDNGSNDTSYAGLDNLEEEIRAAREQMNQQRVPDMDYSKASELDYESFGSYVKRMIAADSSRYGALRRYEIMEYDQLQDILQRFALTQERYYWVDQTRTTEETFNEDFSYNHWYEILELYEGKTLPVDLSDEDVVSIFGCGKFAAFADLSYGC